MVKFFPFYMPFYDFTVNLAVLSTNSKLVRCRMDKDAVDHVVNEIRVC